MLKRATPERPHTISSKTEAVIPSRALKTLCSPFDKPVLSQVEGLRANGPGVEDVGDFPFVLSPSKHVYVFFSSLLEATHEEHPDDCSHLVGPCHNSWG
jgi:hypothetical protein